MSAIASESTLRPALEEIAAARGKLAGPASLAVVERTLDRGHMPPLHVHEEAEASHVLDGSLVLLVGGERVRVESGETFVAPAGEPHATRRGGSARYLGGVVRAVGRALRELPPGRGAAPRQDHRSHTRTTSSWRRSPGRTASASSARRARSRACIRHLRVAPRGDVSAGPPVTVRPSNSSSPLSSPQLCWGDARHQPGTERRLSSVAGAGRQPWKPLRRDRDRVTCR